MTKVEFICGIITVIFSTIAGIMVMSEVISGRLKHDRKMMTSISVFFIVFSAYGIALYIALFTGFSILKVAILMIVNLAVISAITAILAIKKRKAG